MSDTAALRISGARMQLAAIIERARTDHKPVYIARRGRRIAAVIEADDLDRILELAEDMADIRAAEQAPCRDAVDGFDTDTVGRGPGRSRPGMSYEVVLAPAAARQLRKFDPRLHRVRSSVSIAGHDPETMPRPYAQKRPK